MVVFLFRMISEANQIHYICSSLKIGVMFGDGIKQIGRLTEIEYL